MISLINMIPNILSSETHPDSETCITVNPSNPLQIAASAFTLDPGNRPRAPIFVSNDGGETWMLNSIVPAVNSPGTTIDITLCFSPTTNNLYAGVLLNYNPRIHPVELNILRTDNYLGSNLMTVLHDRQDVDQPFIKVGTIPQGIHAGKDIVFMGINDSKTENQGDDFICPATIDILADTGNSAPNVIHSRIDKRKAVWDGPPIRPVIHSDGTVYAVFTAHRDGRRQSDFDTIFTSDIVVVRDDKCGMGPNPFSSLIDPTDNNIGVRVVSNITIPFHNDQFLAQERVGGDLAIAVDPHNSSIVYIAWADQPQNSNSYVLHISRSNDRGNSWSGNDLRTITNAKNPGLAVNSNGTLGLLYQQLTQQKRWDTHIELTKDNFENVQDLLLATVPSNIPLSDLNTPGRGWLPYNGDYDHLVAVDKTFYGIFSANNTPDLANFPNGVKYQRNADFNNHKLLDLDGNKVDVSIDPFFFKVT